MEEKINTLEPEKLHEYRVLLQRNNHLQVGYGTEFFGVKSALSSSLIDSLGTVMRSFFGIESALSLSSSLPGSSGAGMRFSASKTRCRRCRHCLILRGTRLTSFVRSSVIGGRSRCFAGASDCNRSRAGVGTPRYGNHPNNRLVRKGGWMRRGIDSDRITKRCLDKLF